jgi:mannose-1-phosphate guanylyltransferase
LSIIPVILSGGAGTRLWPMSRDECPKQFLSLTDKLTMFQLTLSRVRDTALFLPPIVVANASHLSLIETQMSELDIVDRRLILEPSARNTAPAIALAALSAVDPSSPLLVMPSDHVIENEAAFLDAIHNVLPLVKAGWLATFGIEPTSPETGYGYIKFGTELENTVCKIAEFVEKPELHRAEEMIAAKSYLWNAGIFLFRADRYLEMLSVHAPDILRHVNTAMHKAEIIEHKIYPNAESFAQSPSVSIDYAVMEKAEQSAVVPVSMGWSDVGSWDALYDLGYPHNSSKATQVESSGNLILSDGMRIHIAGLSGVIVIANGGDILIVPRGKSQLVKQVVEQIKKPLV